MNQTNPQEQVYSAFEQAFPSNEAFRVFHGRGGLVRGFEQINIEYYAPVLWCMVYQPVNEAPLMALVESIKANAAAWGIEHIYIQRRHEKGDPVEVIMGDASYIDKEFVVTEQNLKYWVTLGRNQNTGLFLDMAHGRKWVRENCQNKSVLNLFAYTCSLGVAAAAGSARQVVNVDMAKAAIKRGQQNFALNEFSGAGTAFMAQDVFKMIKKIGQKGPYDLVICDPPSFQTKAFDVKKDYAKTLKKIAPFIAEKGKLMLCLNSPALDEQFLIDTVAESIPEARFDGRLENPSVLADKDEQSSLKIMFFSLK